MLQYFIRWHCGERVNKKRIPRLLRELGLKVTPSNPYRGHDTHDHPCDAFTNLLVGRKFYVAPRAVILTDITYLYYSSNAKLIYKCSFIDAFTGEELGTAVSKNMDVSLVMKAYDDMILGHKDEIPDGAIIHSDQGSQFGSRKFRRSVKHDGFLQSMSNRGNSLDNSPMESFFGTFKDEVQLIDYETFAEAEKAVLDYKNFYNNVRPHTGISGWIPTVFYDCCMGISNAVIPNEMDLQHAIDARIAQNKTESSKILEQKYQLTGGAEGQMDRDDEKLSGMIRKFRKSIAGTQKILAACPDAEFKKPCFVRRLKKNIASFEAEIQKLENIKGLLLKARDFYSNASIDVKIKLNDRRIWRNYPEMSYYKKMREMF